VQWFDASGSLLQTAEFPRVDLDDQSDRAQLVLDRNESALVANRCAVDQGCLGKFDSNGNRLWLKRFPYDPDGWHSLALAVGPAGQTVVGVNNRYYAEIITYDTDGKKLWTTRIDNVEDVPNNNVYDIKVDRDGNTYVVAELCDRATHDGDCKTGYLRFVTIKYGPSGNVVWTAERGTEASLEDTEPYSAGSVYVMYEWLSSRLLLSPELAFSSDDDTSDDDDQSSSDDDSDSAGCGC